MPAIPTDQASMLQQIEQARSGNKFALAKLVSLFENQKKEMIALRQVALSFLKDNIDESSAGFFIGVTGTPGAGKSSLIGKVCETLLAQDANIRIAVLAVDPASQVSGGALLGDRTRVQFHKNRSRFYFRSQSSNKDLGGISFSTFHVLRLLRYFFDLIIIETVGIGQSEVAIKDLVDHTLLVMQPLSGDQIQFLKAGIMEIPDTFIVNKCDQEQVAKQSYHALKSSLRQYASVQAGATDRKSARLVHRLFMTSVLNGLGVEELACHLTELVKDASQRSCFQEKEMSYFEQWVKNEYGKYGERNLDQFFNAYTASLELDFLQEKFQHYMDFSRFNTS